MILHALDIPDDRAQWAPWLEKHLASGHLCELVSELRAVHGEPTDRPIRRDAQLMRSLEAVLGDQHAAVLDRGLRSLSPDQLSDLVQQPALLLALQELVLREGGAHWSRLLSQSPELNQVQRRSRDRLENTLGRGASTASLTRRSWATPLLSLVATAALLLLAVFVNRDLNRQAPTAGPVAWGWNKPGALQQDLSRDEYLRSLASAAAEFRKQRPTDAVGVARRIGQFRQGCSVLILSEHKPLAQADADWLRERCQKWATGLDAQIAALEAGADPGQALKAADEIVDKLVKALNERASS